METTKGGIIERTHAEEVLELPKVLNLLANFCHTEPTKKKARALLTISSVRETEAELDRVQLIARAGVSTQFYLPFEPNYLSNEINSRPFLSIDDLLTLKNFLKSIRDLKRNFKNSMIKNFFSNLHEYPEIVNDITNKIDDHGDLFDYASSELSQIRTSKRKAKNRIREVLSNMLMTEPNLFSDVNIVERGGKYVLPLKSNFKKNFKGIVHSYSNTGETVFIEPIEVTEDSAKLIELENREKTEIEAILRGLTALVRLRAEDIERDIEQIIALDLLFAKVCFARELNATRPILGDHINILNGVHPILKQFDDQVVPLNLEMNSGQKVLLISGPNAGGKTVVLKTVGLITLMVKCGLFVPAGEGTVIPFFDEIYADIGDEQSIESHMSTFTGHLKQIKEALQGRENSLILLDELMSQTSVEEGSALAAAILEELSHSNKLVLATTHNENLKIFVSNRKDMINAGMEFTDRPTYHLIFGIPQPSNAIKLARQLGLKDGVIQKAFSYLDKEKMSLNELFETLSKKLKAVEEQREKLSKLIEEYEEKLDAFNLKKKKEFDELKSKYRKELVEAKKEIESLIKNLRKEGPKPDLVHKTRNYFIEKIKSEKSEEPYYPAIGELVRIRALSKIGQVIAEHHGKYKISLEKIFYWVEPSDIESIKDNKN